MPEIVAWDIYEYRIYGAPGEKSHRVLWVDDYRLKNGEVAKDLDVLLEKARDGGIDSGAKTIHVRALVYADEPQPNRLKLQQ